MSRERGAYGWEYHSFPRSRGDEPELRTTMATPQAFSPLTRG